MRIYYRAGLVAAACLVSVVASEQAKAIGYTLVLNDTLTVPTISNGFSVPDFGVPTMDYVASSSPGQYRSPWEGTPYDNLQYTSVRFGVAGYNLTGTSLSLFWGSPDTYNSLTFYTGVGGTGDSVTLSGNILGNPQALSHHLVQILTDVTFRSITIGSGQPAFEFANLSATPIPAALPLFGTGLGLLGWLARRRKRGRAAATAPLAFSGT